MGSVEYHLKDGWKRLEVIRKNGIYAGKADIYIYSPDGNKFRSKKELFHYLTSNNLPYKVEDLFTATDAYGSSSSKAPEKTKKGSAPEKAQASDSGAASKKHCPQPASDSTSIKGTGGVFQSAAVGACQSQKNIASSNQKNAVLSNQKNVAAANQKIVAHPNQKNVAHPNQRTAACQKSVATPSHKTVTPASQKNVPQPPASPGQAAHVMTTAQPGTFNILKERLRSAGSGPGKDVPSNVSPFFQTPQGNPSFVPQKLGKSNLEARILKPPKAPEKPLMPYMRYSRRVWELVKSQNPDLRLWEIGKIIGQQWRDLPDEMKAEFIEEYESEKLEYEKALKIYLNSPAYLNYVQAKNKLTLSNEENRESNERQIPKAYERKIDIQPAEDDDDCDDKCTVKSLAYARYKRNHRLMSEIFSDSLVPEVRFVVTTVRLQILKRQVHSLKLHQIKLESELEHAEEKFQVKRRKINDSYDQFQEEMKKYSYVAVDDEMFEKMVQEQYEILKQELMNKAAESGNTAGSTPSATAVAPPGESFKTQAEEINVYKNLEKEPQEQAEAAESTLPVAVNMEIDMPATENLVNSYSEVVYYPSAQPGHYPVQPSNVPVPSRPQFQYPTLSHQGHYSQYQQTGCHTGGYGYLQYPPYLRAQYFYPDHAVHQGYENVTPMGMRASEHLVPSQQIPNESQPQNVPQLPQSEQASASMLQLLGQQEWEMAAELKTE